MKIDNNQMLHSDPRYEQYAKKIQQDDMYDIPDSDKLVDSGEEDTSKWEIDINPIIDEIYYELLGMVNVGGHWVEDINRNRYMNEKGAQAIRMQLKLIDKTTFLSELNEEYIKKTCRDIGESLSDLFTDMYLKDNEFEMMPIESKMVFICDFIVKKIYHSLMSAKNGGMKKHRERSKFPNPIAYSHNMNQGVM